MYLCVKLLEDMKNFWEAYIFVKYSFVVVVGCVELNIRRNSFHLNSCLIKKKDLETKLKIN